MGIFSVPFSVIVDQIDIGYVGVLETKYNPPVGANGDTPEAGEIALEGVQAEAGEVHVLGARGAVQERQHTGDFIDMLSVQAAAVVVYVKPSQAAVSKAPYHPLLRVVK